MVLPLIKTNHFSNFYSDPNELGLDLSEDNLLNHHYQSNYGLSMDPHSHEQQHLYGGDKYCGPSHSNSHVVISDTSSIMNNSYNNLTGHGNIYAPNIHTSNNGGGPSVQYIHHLPTGHHPGGGGQGQQLLLQTVIPSSIGSHSPSSSSPASSIHYHQAPSLGSGGGQVMMMHSLYHQPGTLTSSPLNHGHHTLSTGCPPTSSSQSQFSTLQMPRRVRVIPTGSNNILTTTVDDIIIAGGHQRTDV